jgi:hypothetical protein
MHEMPDMQNYHNKISKSQIFMDVAPGGGEPW